VTDTLSLELLEGLPVGTTIEIDHIQTMLRFRKVVSRQVGHRPGEGHEPRWERLDMHTGEVRLGPRYTSTELWGAVAEGRSTICVQAVLPFRVVPNPGAT
jgi:hypothetical protein